MSREKTYRWNILVMLSVCFLAASLTALCFICYYSRVQFQTAGYLCGEILERQPSSRQSVMEALKEWERHPEMKQENVLSSFGYRQSDFLRLDYKIFVFAVLGIVLGIGCFLLIFRHSDRRVKNRLTMLADYLDRVTKQEESNLLLMEAEERGMREDLFSGLQDEIYKTVTMLYQTREEALLAKKNYAENLSNIAHQLKTPITAISLSAQMIEEKADVRYAFGIRKQADRLAYLEEALLVLSRIDAGTLELKTGQADIFTLLTFVSDHLEELSNRAGVSIDVPELEEAAVCVDLDWTMEAVMNLVKNCVEHTPAGRAVHCFYEGNPLYVQIQIWDEGEGFVKEDIPHLFERFYVGKGERKNGIGIGLALAKSIIEMQNGIISAYNRPEGGACFEIRFYRH